MTTDKDVPIRVQFYIGKTSSLGMQEWANNQSLPISKAIKEALDQFIRIYGTQDISSDEVRTKLATKVSVPPPVVTTSNELNNNVQNSPVKEKPIPEPEVAKNDSNQNQKKKISINRNINLMGYNK